MTIGWLKYVALIMLVLVLGGCAVFTRSQSSEVEIIDPLVERNRQWQEQIDKGNWAFQNRDFDRALQAYQAAMAIKPNSSETQLKIAEIHFQRQEYEKARDAFAALLKLDTKNVNARNYLGYIHENLNNYEAAAQAYEGALKLDPRNLYTLNHLGLSYKQLQRLDEAEAVLRQALALDPKSTRSASKNTHNYLALIYLERGETGEAIADFRESIRLFPDDVWARQQLAAIYENEGRYYEAELQYYEILQVDPENLLAPARLQTLSQFSSPAFATAEVPPVELIDTDIDAILAQAPDAEVYPDADAILLLNQFSHDVLPTGKSRYTSHQVVKILTDRGSQQYDDIAIPYNPMAQYITVNIARTILPDGSVVEPLDEAYNDVTPPGLLAYNLYSDAMWKVISMPALEPGVCIEYQVTLEDTGGQTVGNETWFWGDFSFQATDVTLQSCYALRVPRDTRFRWKAVNCQLNPQVRHEGEASTYIWTYGETPGLVEEVGMPATKDIAPRLSYSSVRSWDAVYEWYKALAKERYAADEAIEKTVRAITANLEAPSDKVQALYHFVTSKIRYVGIELGQGAYQPSPACQVFKMRYGDCKDKTTLLISMLNLVGIKAFPVLLNPTPYERVDIEIPSLGQFSHVITAVPRDGGTHHWLDATSECSYGDLPASDQGRKGFVIGEVQGEFVDIPAFPPESNRLIVNMEIRLSESGGLHGKMRVDTSGQYNLEARLQYKPVHPGEWTDTFAGELSAQFPGVRIDRVTISDLNNLIVPVHVELEFTVEKYVKRINGSLLFPLPSDEFTDYAQLFAAIERKYPLEFSYPLQMEKTIRIALPQGWTAALPEDIQVAHSFASMDRQYESEGNEIRYKLQFTLKNPIISPEDYPAAKRFFETLAREDRTQLILQKPVKRKA
jgi:tetratricopeptide (TPR) repeat protein